MARALVVDDEACPVAVAVDAVRSVIAGVRLTPVPMAPPFVLGLANVRGDIVPVFDTGVLLDRAPLGPTRFVLVVETRAGPAGLSVTGMPRTETVDDDRLLDPDAVVLR